MVLNKCYYIFVEKVLIYLTIGWCLKQNIFFFKQKTAYEITVWLEFRRVLFRSVKGDSEAHYLSLTQNIAMKDQLNSAIIKKYPIIPDDYSCPSVQPHLRRRICSDCNMYFATFKELNLHKDSHKRKKSTKKQTSLYPSPISSRSTPPPLPSPPPSPPPPRVRPQRIAAKRRGELCALLPTKNWSGKTWMMSILRVLTLQMN